MLGTRPEEEKVSGSGHKHIKTYAHISTDNQNSRVHFDVSNSHCIFKVSTLYFNWTGVLPETSLRVGAQNCLLQLRGTGSRAGQSLYTDIRNPLSCRDSSSQILRDWRTSKGPLYRKSHPSLSKPAGVKPNLS